MNSSPHRFQSKHLLAALAVGLILCPFRAAWAQDETAPPELSEHQPAYARPETAGRVWGHLQAFQQIGPRPPGSPGVQEAGAYFKDQMESLGYAVRREEFTFPNGEAGASWFSGTVPGTEPVVLVAAHLDTAPGSPGVNDDASGVAVLIELAGQLKGARRPVNVRFAAFGAEEDVSGFGHHYSAAKYLEGLPAERGKTIVGVIYVDKVAHGERFRIRRALNRDPSAAKKLQPVALKTLGRPKKVETVWTLQISPFDQYLVPVAWVDWHPAKSVHSPEDTVDHVQIQRMLQTVDVLFRFFSAPR